MKLRAIILSLVFCLLNIEAYAQKDFPFLASVVKDKINVRAGQSFNFEKIFVLNKGDTIVVLDKAFSWYKIQLPSGADSFVSEKYVDSQGKITGDRVNVRAAANVEATIIGQVKAGEQLQIVEKQKDWYKVRPIKNSFGWVAEQFLVFTSKDINLYQEPVLKSEKVIAVEPKPSITDSRSVSVAGYLDKQTDPNVRDIQFVLAVDGKPLYYLRGPQNIFEHFLHYKVVVDGKMDEGGQNYFLPVVGVKRIKLVL